MVAGAIHCRAQIAREQGTVEPVMRAIAVEPSDDEMDALVA
jgi:hypothetical protein